ncbi:MULTISPECIES: J domain-containing protein [Amycolatopsis]|uniref:J domain-containing protein n=1 Tax=Amycolatopsis TaxID=1813 RepID=UPI0023DD8A69|nr:MULTISPECIES: J domain-containing protein [Amycolatopsis]
MDPYAVLGVPREATPAEITAAYRRLVRALHPDAPEPDPGRLAEVLAAYRELRDSPRPAEPPRPEPRAVRRPARRWEPDIRAGPVRRER